MADDAHADLRPENRFVTDDPREAEDRLRTSYKVTGGVRISTTQEFGFSQNMCASSGFAVSRFQCSATIRYQGPLDGLLCVGEVHAGHLCFDTAHGERHSAAGDVYLFPPHGPWRASTSGVDIAPVTLDRDAVARYAAATCGIALEDLVFTGLDPLSPALIEYWIATVAHIRDDIVGDPDIANSPIVITSAFRSLAAGLLSLFPNTALAADSDSGARATGPHVSATRLRDVVDYIHCYADQPIGPEQWTEVAEAPGSAVDGTLRRSRGITAEHELWRARLQGAYRDLFEADRQSGITINDVATRWGFTAARTFAVAYQAAHGETPEQTLRR